MTDTILFVKETRTCEYVLVIHTPRLCGEPGFKSRLEQMPEAAIRCREVVDSVEGADRSLPEAPFPRKRQPRKPIPPPQRPAAEEEGKGAAQDTADRAQLDRAQAQLLRDAFESLLRHGDMEDMAVFEVQQGAQEGEFIFAVGADGQGGFAEGAESERGEGEEEPVAKGRGATLEDALRAAGYNIKGRKNDDEKEEEEREPQPRDEL